MIPIPIPGPIAASPYTRPFPMGVNWLVVVVVCARTTSAFKTWSISSSLSLALRPDVPFFPSVVCLLSPGDIHRGEDGDDERLHRCDEELEAGHDDREDERQHERD